MRVAGSVLWVASLVLCGSFPPRSAGAQCLIEGVVSLPRVRVTELEGRHPRFVSLERRAVTVRPIRHGLVEITGTLPDGRSFVGESRTAPRYEVRAHLSMPGLEVGAGAEVIDLRPLEGSEAVVELALAEGISLREQRIDCAALTTVEDPPRPSDLEPTPAAAPRLNPRGRDLHVRVALGEERSAVLRLRFTDPAAVILLEVGRRESTVEVLLVVPHARISGSVELSDVVPVTARLMDHRVRYPTRRTFRR